MRDVLWRCGLYASLQRRFNWLAPAHRSSPVQHPIVAPAPNTTLPSQPRPAAGPHDANASGVGGRRRASQQGQVTKDETPIHVQGNPPISAAYQHATLGGRERLSRPTHVHPTCLQAPVGAGLPEIDGLRSGLGGDLLIYGACRTESA